MGVLKFTMCLWIFSFTVTRSIVHFVDGAGKKSQNWSLFVDFRNAIRNKIKAYHLPFM